MIKYFYLIQIIALLFILGCATSEELQNDSSKEYPVTLIVSNQNSLTIEPVHVIVKMKEYSRQRQKTNSPENIIVNQDFDNKVGHSFSSFRLNLTEGGHRIIAETNNNNYKLDVSFEIDRPTWLYLSYLDNNQFRLQISYTPFVFG